MFYKVLSMIHGVNLLSIAIILLHLCARNIHEN